MRITADPRPATTLADVAAADLTDPDYYATGDPHPIWHAMRTHAPAYRHLLPDGRSYVSITRHADVCDVLRDHRRFTSRRGTMLSVLGGNDPAGDKMMAACDPPVHTALRAPLAKVLSHAALRSRAPRIRSVVRDLLRPLATGEPCDLAELAAAFPMAFTGALMGLPREDWPELTRLTTMAVAPTDAVFAGDAGNRALVTAHHELFEYFGDRARVHAGRDDLIGFLTALPVGDRRMRVDELVYNCYSLLLGANVTTPHTIAAAVLAFIEHPEQYRRVTEPGADLGLALEEALRWSSPANHFLRHVVADTEIAGLRLHAGEAVVAWLGSANRDELVFADPYELDVTRSPNRHVAFGMGPHYCIGAPLARIALGVWFEEMTAAVAEFQLAGPVEHLRSNFAAGIRRMPVTARLRDGTEPARAAARSAG